jgi:hypothetical protein
MGVGRPKKYLQGLKVLKVYLQESEYDMFQKLCGGNFSEWTRQAMMNYAHDTLAREIGKGSIPAEDSWGSGVKQAGAPILQESGNSESRLRKRVQRAVTRPATTEGVGSSRSGEPGQDVSGGLHVGGENDWKKCPNCPAGIVRPTGGSMPGSGRIFGCNNCSMKASEGKLWGVKA